MKHISYATVLPIALAAGCLLTQTASAQAGSGRSWMGHSIRVSFVSGRGTGHGLFFASQRGSAASTTSLGYLGIDFRDVTDDRVGTLKLREPRGAEIVQVDHDGPAGKADLREHDVILQINGQVVEGKEQLRRVLHEIPAGRPITIILSRDGQQQTVATQMADRATVERQAWEERLTVPEPATSMRRSGSSGFLGGPPITAPPDPPAHSFIGTVMLGSSYTGAALEMIGPQLAQFFGSQGGNGLLVRSVDPNSPAATAGLRAGDVVVRANAVILTGLGEWSRLVRESKGKPLSVVVVRDKQEQTFVLTPDSKKRSCLEFQMIPLDAQPVTVSQESFDTSFGFLWMN